MWQFGDSELGGWVYDPTLRVTCPTDPCSVLKCGFRAQCVYDSTKQAHCVCRPGYTGNALKRCYPKVCVGPFKIKITRVMSYHLLGASESVQIKLSLHKKSNVKRLWITSWGQHHFATEDCKRHIPFQIEQGKVCTNNCLPRLSLQFLLS